MGFGFNLVINGSDQNGYNMYLSATGLFSFVQAFTDLLLILITYSNLTNRLLLFISRKNTFGFRLLQ